MLEKIEAALTNEIERIANIRQRSTAKKKVNLKNLLSLIKNLQQPGNAPFKDYLENFLETYGISPADLVSPEAIRFVFLKSVEQGQLDIVRFIIENHCANLNILYIPPILKQNMHHMLRLNINEKLIQYINQSGDALCFAAKSGQFNIVKYLLENTQINPAAHAHISIRIALITGQIDIVLLFAAHPAVQAELNEYKRQGLFPVLCQKVDELSPVLNFFNNSFLFFQSPFVHQDISKHIIQIGCKLINMDFNPSDTCLKNILSIKPDRFFIKEGSLIPENGISLKSSL